MCSVLFLKSPGYETVRLHSQHNPHSYWYSFNFEARNSMFIYLFVGNWPPIPHGTPFSIELLNWVILMFFDFRCWSCWWNDLPVDLSFPRYSAWFERHWNGTLVENDSSLDKLHEIRVTKKVRLFERINTRKPCWTQRSDARRCRTFARHSQIRAIQQRKWILHGYWSGLVR